MSSMAMPSGAAPFDAVAADYERALGHGLRLSGEGPQYFARRRIDWTARLLRRERTTRVLDFGCGVGLATCELRQRLGAESAWGFDPSTAAIERARRDVAERGILFTAHVDDLPQGEFDVAYCNGVFHHIPLGERRAALLTIARTLRPGGWLALWENNPWNPGTRWVMRRIPFDRDADPLSPPQTRRMVRDAGFRVARTDAWFIFPRALRWLRPVERLVHRLPLGGQYLVLAQWPGRSGQSA
ncbi:MAG: class I SAM-dependent methyltransferase [Planctomycetota bacterium]|nr:MAG: class I SAM-dependent methyltransferase [Planctomycetota bacterium]